MLQTPEFGDWLPLDDERFWDPDEFFPRHWMIRPTEGGSPIPFRLRDEQRFLAAAVLACYAQRKWLVFVKPRKIGSSTLFTGVVTQHAMFRNGCYAGILAQKNSVAKELAGTAIRMHRNCPDPIRTKKLPGLKRTLEFPEIESKLDIASVMEDDPLRGSTGIQALLATELCKWGTRGPETWASVLSNVPRDTGFVIAESTPLYYGDPLQKLYESADHPDSPWFKVFIPWTMVSSYAAPPPPGWEPKGPMLDYANDHHLTIEQAYWMATDGVPKSAGRLDKFRAEYPINDIDCWQQAGDAVFNPARLMAMSKAIDNGTGILAETTEYIEWESPEDPLYQHDRFIITVDPAGSWSEKDMFGVEILNASKCTQSAEYMGHTTAYAMARSLVQWGERYNRATIYVELNGVGEAVVSHLIEMGYPNVYFRTTQSMIVGEQSKKPGWHANSATKAEAVSSMQMLLDDGSIMLRSHRLIRQLTNYRGQWDKLARDAEGGHFDLVAAICIAAWAWRHEVGAGAANFRLESDKQAAERAWREFLQRIDNHGAGGDNTPWGRHL